MLTPAATLTLATDTTLSAVVSVLSVCVALAGIVLVIIHRLKDRADMEREKRADERHGVLVEKLTETNTAVTETQKTVATFRGEVSTEIAALHRADSALALDLERRVAPIEGRLGIGRLAAENGGQD